ncbi:hypothetical protein [Desulfonema magnum]|uniref:Uncharacterized protein n=1 Tax=Desulfonema magnum TaxID=45655 RepID=A0A975BNQ0_9BACT|nr:hypothetical protein [Desulfonema magnum]QTA88359.1 Uncharacterized protein dnm_044030 [Desulfonema magnum]
MEVNFFKWTEGILNNFSNCLICKNYESLLWFVSIGIALTIIALNLKIPSYELLQKIYTGEIFPSLPVDNKKYLRQVRLYIRLLFFIENAGICYFLATICLVLLTTSPQPLRPPYILLSNLTFLLVVIPTVLIGLYYSYLKIFKKM